MDKKMTLGGFEAVLDSFIPNPDSGFRNSNVDENVNVNADEFESLDDEELEDIKNNNIEVKNKKEKPVEEQVYAFASPTCNTRQPIPSKYACTFTQSTPKTFLCGVSLASM